MIKNKQPGGFSSLITRLVLIFLAVIFVITAGAFVLRYSIVSKLDHLSSQLDSQSSKPGFGKSLVDLSLAETQFQQASSSGDKKALEAYKTTLSNVFKGLADLLNTYQSRSSSPSSSSKNQLSEALKQKLEVSEQIFGLQKRFDSLFRLTTLKAIQPRKANARSEIVEKRIDTVVQTREESTKAGLIQRLKNALQNRNKVKILTIREREAQHKTGTLYTDRSLLDSLGRQYGKLSRSGRRLVDANFKLLAELRQLLEQMQLIEQQAYEKQRETALLAYRSATAELNTYVGIALCLILLLIAMLFAYLRRISFAERRLRVANTKAFNLAGQKSEILAIMSHEIRNKLMAINGAVYMIRKTVLSAEQEKKVQSIHLSSDMLLETVNNVLDMSKLEQRPVELSLQEFYPEQAIADSVEAMRFMAENKNITLALEFKGSTEQLVKGDSFRLKQVLINLLSNAIKYTDEGGVAVSAAIDTQVENAELTVVIRDTGPGIPKSRQAKLFSPYYQAGGQKPGTGLGLYLCRQLVQLQGGKISLESEAGEGCAVTFKIPYLVNAGDR